jgi:hypothetical protein
MHSEGRASAIRRFFAGVTEYAFHARLGVADPPLVDYIAELLVRFVRSDELYRVRSVRGQRLTLVADMLVEAQHRHGPARQQVHRHIGDFTLFWTGVYPEVVAAMRRGGKDALLDYQQQGKRAYWIASTMPVEAKETEKSAPADVLKRLSERFELCVYGLGEVRRQWEQQSGDADAPLLLG